MSYAYGACALELHFFVMSISWTLDGVQLLVPGREKPIKNLTSQKPSKHVCLFFLDLERRFASRNNKDLALTLVSCTTVPASNMERPRMTRSSCGVMAALSIAQDRCHASLSMFEELMSWLRHEQAVVKDRYLRRASDTGEQRCSSVKFHI